MSRLYYLEVSESEFLPGLYTALMNTCNRDPIFDCSSQSLVLTDFSWEKRYRQVALFTSVALEYYFLVSLRFIENEHLAKPARDWSCFAGAKRVLSAEEK